MDSDEEDLPRLNRGPQHPKNIREAIIAKNYSLVSLFARAANTLNVPAEGGNTPLMLAILLAEDGDAVRHQIIRLLLEQKTVDVSVENHKHHSALQLAQKVATTHDNIVPLQLLLVSGKIPVTPPGSGDATSMRLGSRVINGSDAIRIRDPAVLLEKFNWDPVYIMHSLREHHKWWFREEEVVTYAAQGQLPEIRRSLSLQGMDEWILWKALIRACEGKHLKTAEFLLNTYLPMIKFYDSARSTILHMAVKGGWSEGAVRFLVQEILRLGHRDLLEAEDGAHRTPLAAAVHFKNTPAIRLLLELGNMGVHGSKERQDSSALKIALEQAQQTSYVAGLELLVASGKVKSVPPSSSLHRSLESAPEVTLHRLREKWTWFFDEEKLIAQAYNGTAGELRRLMGRANTRFFNEAFFMACKNGAVWMMREMLGKSGLLRPDPATLSPKVHGNQSAERGLSLCHLNFGFLLHQQENIFHLASNEKSGNSLFFLLTQGFGLPEWVNHRNLLSGTPLDQLCMASNYLGVMLMLAYAGDLDTQGTREVLRLVEQGHNVYYAVTTYRAFSHKVHVLLDMYESDARAVKLALQEQFRGMNREQVEAHLDKAFDFVGQLMSGGRPKALPSPFRPLDISTSRDIQLSPSIPETPPKKAKTAAAAENAWPHEAEDWKTTAKKSPAVSAPRMFIFPPASSSSSSSKTFNPRYGVVSKPRSPLQTSTNAPPRSPPPAATNSPEFDLMWDEDFEGNNESAALRQFLGKSNGKKLYDAVKKNDKVLVNKLVTNRFLDVNWHNPANFGRTALMVASSTGGDLVILDLLLFVGDIDVNDVDQGKNTALFYAITSENLQGIGHLFSNGKGLDPNKENSMNQTPLSYSCFRGSIKCVAKILQMSVLQNLPLNMNGKLNIPANAYLQAQNYGSVNPPVSAAMTELLRIYEQKDIQGLTTKTVEILGEDFYMKPAVF